MDYMPPLTSPTSPVGINAAFKSKLHWTTEVVKTKSKVSKSQENKLIKNCKSESSIKSNLCQLGVNFIVSRTITIRRNVTASAARNKRVPGRQ